MTTEGNKITASEGYVLRRISDGFIYGNEVYLGYTHYLHGELLDEPLLELPEHFEEVEKPIENDSVNNYEEWTESQKVAWEEEHQPKLPPEPESPYTDSEEIPPA